MRKMIVLVLALVMCVGTSTALAKPDIQEVKLIYAQEVAQKLNNENLFEGTDKGFELEKKLTRAEMCTLLDRLLPKGEFTSVAEFYTDMQDDHWAAGAICNLTAYGWVNGFEDKSFRPDEWVKAGELSAMLIRATGYSMLTDEECYPWYSNIMKIAKENGIFENLDGVVENEPVSRATAVIMYYNALNIPMVQTTGMNFEGGSLVPTVEIMDGTTEDKPLTTLFSEYKKMLEEAN